MADSTTVKRTKDDGDLRANVLGGEADKRAEADPHVAELTAKVAALVASKFGGDYKKAFDFYDQDHDGMISTDELATMLSDADVGSMFTRGMWTSGIIDKLDTNGDGKIGWGEFQSVLHG